MAAVVDEHLILASDVRESVPPLEAERVRRQYTNDPALTERKLRQQQRDTLERLIDDELILREAIRAGHRISEEHVTEYIERVTTNSYGNSNVFLKTLATRGMTLEQFREQHRRDDLVSGARRAKVAAIPPPTPQQIEEYYHSHEKDFGVNESVKIRLLTIGKITPNVLAAIESQRKVATEAHALLAQGKDLAEVAQGYREGGLAVQCGEWGWWERRSLRKELAEPAFSLKPGGLSPSSAVWGWKEEFLRAELPERAGSGEPRAAMAV